MAVIATCSPCEARGLSVVRSLEVLLVPISEVEMYVMYATIGWWRAVCPLLGRSVIGGSNVGTLQK